MMKWLILALVVWLVLGWLQRKPRAAAPAQPPEPARAPDAMVRCTHCGLHLPQTEALSDTQGRPYCSPRHRDEGPA